LLLWRSDLLCVCVDSSAWCQAARSGQHAAASASDAQRGAAQDERERKWRVQAVSVSAGSFQNRRSLPAAWRGLRDAELCAAAGIPGLVFVHASGFIGGADTQAAAVEMARRALAED